MRAAITGTLFALAIGVTAAAQDSKVTSRTKVSGDDAKAVVMRGCLQQTAAGNGFLLLGGITASGEDLKSKTTTKTDVDEDKTTVKGKSTTKIDNDDRAVATAGTAYTVTARSGVDLASHAGEDVEISAILIEARSKGGDKKADITIKDETKIARDDAPDSKVQSKSKAEVARSPLPQLMAVSVKSVGRACSAQ
jgi:hypothetical protein